MLTVYNQMMMVSCIYPPCSHPKTQVAKSLLVAITKGSGRMDDQGRTICNKSVLW